MLNHKINTVLFVLFSLAFLFFRQGYELSFWLWVGVFLVWLSLTIVGSFSIQLNYHLKAIHQNTNEQHNRIALTFDDGPTLFTNGVLDLLKKYNQKATFFCIGKQVEKYPEIIERIIAEGHTLGNHTYSHSTKTGFLNMSEMAQEIQLADESLEKIIKKSPKFYRPPFGVTNPSVKKAVKDTGHTVIGWSIRSLDTVLKSEEKIIKRIQKRLKPGKVVLMHDTSEKTTRVLKAILENNKRFTSVGVDQLFNLQAYDN